MLPVVFVMFDLLNTPMATSTTRGRLRQVLVSKRVHLSTMIALVLITVGMNRDGTYEHADTIILSPGQRLLKVLFMVAFFPRAAVWPAGLRPHYKVFPSDLQLSPGEDLALSYPASDTCLSAAVVFGMFVVALTHAVDVYVSQRTRAALVRPLSVSFFLFCPSLFLFFYFFIFYCYIFNLFPPPPPPPVFFAPPPLLPSAPFFCQTLPRSRCRVKMQRPWLLAGWVSYIVLLLPTSGLIQHGIVTKTADRLISSLPSFLLSFNMCPSFLQ
jgi:hypothetical protein